MNFYFFFFFFFFFTRPVDFGFGHGRPVTPFRAGSIGMARHLRLAPVHSTVDLHIWARSTGAFPSRHNPSASLGSTCSKTRSAISTLHGRPSIIPRSTGASGCSVMHKVISALDAHGRPSTSARWTVASGSLGRQHRDISDRLGMSRSTFAFGQGGP